MAASAAEVAAARARAEALQHPVTRVVLAQVADPRADIANERRKATFDVNDLAALLIGSAEKVQRKFELISALAADPTFSKEERYYMNVPEVYEYGLKVSSKMRDKIAELGVTKMNDMQILRNAIATPTGFDLHYGMFLPTINGQASDEQKDEWLGKVPGRTGAVQALANEILGTYAQTELGHGTFLRGLETTATYDKASQEFIIHSPTVTSLKWWPGGLGKTCNFVILMARLFLDGKDLGPHPFFVQIRNLKDHSALPGIEVGDIGPKIGFQAVDNGFLRFDHFRIPRETMLMKYVEVTPDGRYVRKPGATEKSSYGTMIFVRAYIVAGAASALAKALTISVRYSAVRRQTTRQEGTLESQVLDYTNQQYQLFPLISTAFALHFTGAYMLNLYSSFQKNSQDGNTSALPEVHATSAGLKALVTQLATQGIETCRLACGGHGYHHYSGLPLLYQDYVGAQTYEGENTVMSLQTARYLVKVTELSRNGEPLVGNTRYLEGAVDRLDKEACDVRSAEEWLNPQKQLAAYGHRAARIIFQASDAYHAQLRAGVEAETAWNNNAVDLVRASKAHCFYILLVNFLDAVQAMKASPTRDILKTLCDLFALTNIELFLGDFVEDGYLNRRQVTLVREQVRALLGAVRPNAVALVDAWSFHDYELNSALGRYDGDVYNALYEWAKRNPVNKKHTGRGYEEYLKPKFTANL